jgi:glycosyltransferase involved in cell wall biosynthesis
MSKKILIDFEKSRDPYSGLGQFLLFLRAEFQKLNQQLEYFNPPKKNIHKYTSLFMPDCDVFHAIHQDSPYLPRKKSTKYILTIHDLNGLYETENPIIKKRYLERLQKKIDRANHLTFISEFTKSEVEKNLNIENKKSTVIYNGISLPLNSKSMDINLERPFLFTIGTVVPKKNFHVLIEMMLNLPEYNLFIAGTTFHHYANEMKNKIEKLGLSNRIYFLGTIDNEEKKWLYENSKGFIFPSLFEGFGLPVVEAMSIGTPLFISNKTSLPEIGGDVAFYFNDFNPLTMAKTVTDGIKYFSEEKKHLLIDRSKRFSWEQAAKKYLEIYSN